MNEKPKQNELLTQTALAYNLLMTKESTKKAFQKALSDHMLLNLSPEEEAAIREYYGLEEGWED